MTANEECEHGIKRDDHCCWCEGCPTPVGTWRVGRKVGRTIYAQLGPEPSDDDPLIGVMDTPELAAAVVASRASIGPDSERIRELEAENAQLRRQLNEAHGLRIEAQNPGIDMDEVRRTRAERNGTVPELDAGSKCEGWRCNR